MSKTKMLKHEQEGHLLFVAVEGAIEDWACYVGLVKDGVDHVRRWGDKTSEAKARELFPEFSHLRWRP